MIDNTKIAVVIPCYKVARQIQTFLKTLPDWLDLIVCVDDKCPQNSGKLAKQTKLSNLEVIFREKNGGMGAAMKVGARYAIASNCDIIIKMDGDGQMDSRYLKKLVEPLVIFGGVFGIYKWIEGVQLNQPNSAGTVMLSIIPILLGIQLLLQAISIDINKNNKH